MFWAVVLTLIDAGQVVTLFSPAAHFKRAIAWLPILGLIRTHILSVLIFLPCSGDPNPRHFSVRLEPRRCAWDRKARRGQDYSQPRKQRPRPLAIAPAAHIVSRADLNVRHV